jgi:hypothetical protein
MFRGMGPSVTELRTIPLFQGFGDDELAQIGKRFDRVDGALFDVGEPAT